jgi:hypothetical protein
MLKWKGKNGELYKNWGNNVYSFTLPIPSNRTDTPEICIEHLYSDNIIKTEIGTEDPNIKRRLYIGNEFDSRGYADALGVFCEKKTACGPEKINIIGGSTGERVTLLSDENVNVALSKMTFANMILEEKDPLDNIDFSGFVAIFEILKRIIDDETV